MRLPQDMKPKEPMGDSFAYREAYSNRDLAVTISYGEVNGVLISGLRHLIRVTPHSRALKSLLITSLS